jgi:hypothetical protein
MTAAFAQTPITACGDVVPARGRGVVMNDITCASSDPFVVSIDDRGRLDLGGFTLSGAQRGIRCTGKCIVSSTGGTGTIRDANFGLSLQGSRTRISNLALENNSFHIIADFTTALVRGDQVSVTGLGFGIQAKKARFDGLTVTDASPAIQAQRIVVNGCAITGSLTSAVRGTRATLTNCTLSGNDPVDLETLHRPRLTATTCERSANLGQGGTWGVCSLD